MISLADFRKNLPALLKAALRKFIKYILIIAILLAIGASSISGYTYYILTHWKTPYNQTVVINPNTRVSAIVETLAEKKLVPNFAFGYAYAMYYTIKGKYFQNGEYYFDEALDIRMVFQKLLKGERVIRKVTIPEGYTVKQTIELLNKTYGLMGEVDIVPAEGSLLPETYYYYYGNTKASILTRMQNKLNLLLEVTPCFLDRKSMLALASVVEKESSKEDEKPRIAAVFLNRLKINMPLQSDATIIYSLSYGYGTLNRTVTPADLKVDDPYNSYLYRGLPPTPIANSGKTSIEAVAYPAQTNELYFVADGSGGHNFAKTYAEHQRNIQFLRRKLALQQVNNQTANPAGK
jgi:UPF0755 protein